MKPIFIQLTSTTNEPLFVNVSNILYLKKGTSNSTTIVLGTNVEIFVNETYEELEEELPKVIQNSNFKPF